MSEDNISRKAAIDICNNAIDLWHGQLGEGIVIAVKKKIEELPSAQPEIVRCKDCAKREICRTSNVWAVAPSDDWFCADAERRTDE